MNKTARLGMILTVTEKACVKRLAEIEGGLSEAALIRRLIREAAKQHSLLLTELNQDASESKGAQNA